MCIQGPHKIVSSVGADGYYLAYKPITLPCILFIFIEMKFIHRYSCVMFAMKLMNICHDYIIYDEIIIQRSLVIKQIF